jgi:Ni,Fe-hydrogenase maturation factor
VKTAIYGIGNILLGDDGVGPAVVEPFPLITRCRPEITAIVAGGGGSTVAAAAVQREVARRADEA